MTEVVQLPTDELVPTSDDLPVRPPEPDDAPISWVHSEWIEASLGDVDTNSLEISARGAASAQAEIEDKLIDS